MNLISTRTKNTLNKQMIKLFFALLIPSTIIFSYHFLTKYYPGSDEAIYVRAPVEIYSNSKDTGYIISLYDYWHNKSFFKPILHPFVYSFYLYLTNGNLLLSLKIALSIFYLIYLGYIFYLSRIFLNFYASTLVIILCGLPIWLLQSSTQLMSELPYLMASVAAIFHFLKSKFFFNAKHTIASAVWSSLAICFRPIESIIILGGATLLLIIKNILTKELKLKNVLPIIIYLFFSILLIIFKPTPQIKYFDFLFLLTFTVSGIVLIIIESLKLDKNLQYFLLIIFTVTVIWYLPNLSSLINWVYTCSFGEYVIEASQKASLTGIDFLSLYINDLGYLIFFLMVISLLGLQLNESYVFIKNNKFNILLFLYISTFLSLISTTSPSVDTRYYYLSWISIIFALGVIALNNSNHLKKTRFFLITLVSIGNIITAVYFLRFHPINKNLMNFYGFSTSINSLDLNDESLDFFNHLKKHIKEPNVNILYIENTTSNQAEDAARHQIILIYSLLEGLKWNFSTYEVLNASNDFNILMQFVLNSFDYIHIGPIETVLPHATPQENEFYKLLSNIDTSKIEKTLPIKFIANKCAKAKFGGQGCFHLFKVLKTTAY